MRATAADRVTADRPVAPAAAGAEPRPAVSADGRSPARGAGTANDAEDDHADDGCEETRGSEDGDADVEETGGVEDGDADVEEIRGVEDDNVDDGGADDDCGETRDVGDGADDGCEETCGVEDGDVEDDDAEIRGVRDGGRDDGCEETRGVEDGDVEDDDAEIRGVRDGGRDDGCEETRGVEDGGVEDGGADDGGVPSRLEGAGASGKGPDVRAAPVGGGVVPWNGAPGDGGADGTVIDTAPRPVSSSVRTRPRRTSR